MPLPLRWLLLVVLVSVLPYLVVNQLAWLPTQSHEMAAIAGGIAAGIFVVATIFFAFALPKIFARYYDAKKLTGSQYQTPLRTFAMSAEKLGMPVPELLMFNDGAPHAFGAGLTPASNTVYITRGLFESLDPDQLQAYLDFILVQMKRGETSLMTFGAGAAYFMLLPIKIADLADNDALRTILTLIFGWLGAIYIQTIGMRAVCYEMDQLAGRHHGPTGALALGAALNTGTKVLFKHPLEKIDYASSPMFVVNPLGGRGVAAIFATHVPTPKRVKKLQRTGTKVVGKEAVAKSKGLV
ncbi:MAG: M48 family metalloprotease [bacterium]